MALRQPELSFIPTHQRLERLVFMLELFQLFFQGQGFRSFFHTFQIRYPAGESYLEM